jgi:glycosyltransferase involved in cell wall biosynthesis
MKIALVAQHAVSQPGTGQFGDQRLLELSRSLASKGHHVTVYAQRPAASVPVRAQVEAGVSVEYLGPVDGQPADADSQHGQHADEIALLAQVPGFSRPLHDRLAQQRPDVVHALRWTSGLAALAATRDLRIPVVQTFDSLGVAERRHHIIPRDAGTERIRLEPAIGRSASAVVAGSSAEESDLARLGVPRRSIRVVPCGVDTDEFTPEGPVAERTARPLLLTVADLAEQSTFGEHSAIATLLRAMTKLPGADLVIVECAERAERGDDLSSRRLAKLANTLGVAPQVTFAGQVGHAALPPLLRSADLLVSVSDYDPTGMLAVQAMACGTPVVATAVGGQVDAIVDGTTGILVPSGSPMLLAKRIRQLLAHPMLLEAFSLAAADRARSRYSWDRIAHETLAVYDTAREAA